MLSNNLVSVVVPCTDRLQGIDRCIKSALDQRFAGELEIIVVENNSTDKTQIPSLLSEINDVRIKHYYMDSCENANCARNYGADISSGSYVAFLDSDDWWSEDHIRTSLKEANKGHKAVYSGFILDNGFFCKEKKSRQIQNETAYEFLFGEKSSVAQTSSFFIERSVFDKCRWDESLKRSQDYDFFITVQKNYGWILKEKLTAYVYWQEGMVRSLSVDAFKLFYDKHSCFMTDKERAEYLIEMLKAIVLHSREGFECFLVLISDVRQSLRVKDRIFSYNYRLSLVLVKLRSFLRRFV